MHASQSLDLELLSALPGNPKLTVEASPFVVSYIASVDGEPHIFFANFSGIVPRRNVKPTPETTTRAIIATNANATLSFLPFLGMEQTLTGERSGDKLIFHLPPFGPGAVVWLNDSK